jgi:hypothetical protein
MEINANDTIFMRYKWFFGFKDGFLWFWDFLLINNDHICLKLKHSQLKSLLNEKVVFSRNKSDTSIRLSANERLFILVGTLKTKISILSNLLYLIRPVSHIHGWRIMNFIMSTLSNSNAMFQYKNLTLSLSNHSILFIRVTELVTSDTSSGKCQSSSTDAITNQCQYRSHFNSTNLESTLIGEDYFDLFSFWDFKKCDRNVWNLAKEIRLSCIENSFRKRRLLMRPDTLYVWSQWT